MTNEAGNRVLSRQGARMLSDQEMQMVNGAAGTVVRTNCFGCPHDFRFD